MGTDNSKQRIVIDVDGTLAMVKAPDQTYAEIQPQPEVVRRLREYRDLGFYIIIQSSRNMRTYDNNLGLIQANTLPVLIDWLRRHDVPFDEVHVGKPWCGFDGFYVDDKAIRPTEFLSLSYEEVRELIGGGND